MVAKNHEKISENMKQNEIEGKTFLFLSNRGTKPEPETKLATNRRQHMKNKNCSEKLRKNKKDQKKT